VAPRPKGCGLHPYLHPSPCGADGLLGSLRCGVCRYHRP
jgi:hypothetical protein